MKEKTWGNPSGGAVGVGDLVLLKCQFMWDQPSQAASSATLQSYGVNNQEEAGFNFRSA